MNKLKQKKINNKKHISKKVIRRNNAKLYPIYKMFSWDLISFYGIEFLFYTLTKGLSASGILIISALYILFRILMQMPAVTLTDILGHRKSLIIGNSLISLFVLGLIVSPNIYFIIIAALFRALGYDIKVIVETNLLYDSVSTRGGEGLYSKLDSKGASWYYWLDGVICICIGYLFVINNYFPMFICLGFTIISTILSLKFNDVHATKRDENKRFKNVLKEYSIDLKSSFKFIVRSNRIRSYIIFGAIFYGVITVLDVFRNNVLIFKGVPAAEYSMIFAVLILLAGLSVKSSRKIHKKFRNRTLTVVSLFYIACCLVVGIIANVCNTNICIPLIIIMFALMKMASSVWYVYEYKYLKNFTTPEIRNKIMFTYELIGGIVTSLLSFLGSIILKIFNPSQGFLILSLIAFIGIVLSLDYMRNRIGLRPQDYKKEDIEFMK